MKDRLVVVCMVVIAMALIVGLLSLVPGFVGDPKKEHKGLDEITNIDRHYHPPTLIIALTGTVNGKSLTNEQEEVFKGGLLSSAAWHLPFGCDIKGRNVLGMATHGLWMAFVIGVITTIIAIIIAVPIGAVAGYFGGFVDELIVWFYTTLVSIPQLLLLIALIANLPSFQKYFDLEWKHWPLMLILIVIGITAWVGLARLIRAEFLKHKVREYVQAARALGFGHSRIIFKHILPNVSHIIVITFTISFIAAVNLEVFLSFIGVGIPPSAATWGRMIAKAKDELTRDPSVWWPLTCATLFLFVLSLAFSIFGDALRDALDPKLRT